MGMATSTRRRGGVLASVGRSLLDALTAPHGPDRYLELVHPAWSLREVRAVVADVRRSAGSVTLLVRPNRNWSGFRAGQHVQLQVEIDGAWRGRCYSIVTSEHDRTGLLEFTVALDPDGLVSRHLYRHVTRGTVLRLSGPQGPFGLPTPRPDRLLLISGGSGITPVMSILRTLCDEGRADTVTFLHYARDPDRLAYRAQLDTLAARHPGLRLLRSYTGAGGGELSGRFTPAHLAGVEDVPAWVCGPAGLVDAVREHWTAAARTAPLTVEYFTPPRPVLTPVDANPAGRVRFLASDATTENNGAPLLEQAEAAGLRPEHGCRMGICFSCTRRLVDGSVRNRNTGVVVSEPDTDIQLCISTPCGDVSIDL